MSITLSTQLCSMGSMQLFTPAKYFCGGWSITNNRAVLHSIIADGLFICMHSFVAGNLSIALQVLTK